MTDGTERPLEARLRAALARTAHDSVTDRETPPPLRLDVEDRRAARRPRRPPWALPLLVAASVAAVVVGSAVAVHLVNERDGSPALSAPEPTGITPSPSAPPASGSSSDGPPPAEWFVAADIAALAHPDLVCAAGSGASVVRTGTAVVAGESSPLGIAAVGCLPASASSPQVVEVYRYSPSGPVRLQALPLPTDQGLVSIRAITAANGTLTLDAIGHSPSAPLGSPDLHFRATYVWESPSRSFAFAAISDALAPCTADQLTTTSTRGSLISGDSLYLVLVYSATGPVPCTLNGLPVVTFIDGEGAALVSGVPATASQISDPSFPLTGQEITVTSSMPASVAVHWSCCAYSPPFDVCVQATDIRTAPPGISTEAVLTVNAQVCGPPQISAVVSGPTGMTS